MPTLIIQVYDGRVTIAAPAQVPPELMADAQEVASIEEAAQVVQDVLGQDAGAGEEQQQDATGGAAAPTSQPPQGGEPTDGGGQDSPQAGDEDAAMDEGFNRAKKGRY